MRPGSGKPEYLGKTNPFASVTVVTLRIQILPGDLADQIAAGEVVERPASVVKELVENAIDAGARRVDVDVADGGQSLIRVSDDGSGMERADALLSVQRHATSKLRSRDDLFAIHTLGFRGEALPSIASVSRFSLITRSEEFSIEPRAGTRITVDGGSPPVASDEGCAKGTRVEVRDLFYNVPARLKFLKSKATEGGHVASVCLRAALAHHELTIQLRRDGRLAQEFLRASDPMQRVQAVFADEKLATYEGSFEGARVLAALGAPERARSGSAQLHLYVNRRPVRDTALSRAISYAYGSVLPPGRYPFGVVYLEVDPSEVDVNVHPQKLEVRFARGRALLDALTRFLAKALGTSAFSGPASRGGSYWQARLSPAIAGPAATPGLGYLQPAAAAAISGGTTSTAGDPTDAADPWQLDGSRGAAGDRVSDAASPPLIGARGFFGSLRPLGQAQRMFLICEGHDALYVLDQHAADERVRFDSLRRAHLAREVRVQVLLFPERMECSEIEAQAVEDHHQELAALGLPCSRLGPTTVAIMGVPALLTRATPTRLLRDVLTELAHAGERAFSDAIDMALATMACHGAIRAGDALDPQEIAELLRSLDEVSDFQGHCPHGRPIVCTLPFRELEHRLGR